MATRAGLLPILRNASQALVAARTFDAAGDPPFDQRQLPKLGIPANSTGLVLARLMQLLEAYGGGV